jgi:hypothetical protein
MSKYFFKGNCKYNHAFEEVLKEVFEVIAKTQLCLKYELAIFWIDL